MELAGTAAKGAKALERSNYDLVLLDLMMPDRSGMEVLHEVRQRDTETPIIMMTAYGSLEVAVTALKAGANDYLAKPWDNEKLLVEIRTQIDKRRLQHENIQLKRALKAALQLSRTSSARASGCCACSTWCRRWRPAAPPSC